MKKAPFALSSIVVTAGLMLTSASCSQVLYAPAYQTGTISHVVAVSLKNPGSDADRKKIIQACRELRKISGVYDVEVGNALRSDRPVVVKDVDMGIIVTFRDEASLRAYETDPAHQRVVKDVLEPLTDMSKLRVYDFVNQEP